MERSGGKKDCSISWVDVESIIFAGGSAGSGGNAMGTISAAGDMAALGDGMQSIRFKAGGTAEYVEELPTDFIQAAQILIDDELETYMGIRDSALSSDILDFWTSAEDPDQFATSLDNHLGEGIIPDDAIFRIDEALGKLKSQFK